ncbi:cell division protein ZapB [Desulfovibrio sp. OttesenSCG-928-A18]|nr:cell division protein ZapB [Desulfovibrio sp. OttesenSCG-928-A18]
MEQRISVLLERYEKLSAENAALREQRAGELSSLERENRFLKEELEKERTVRNKALTRIEALAERIKERSEQE